MRSDEFVPPVQLLLAEQYAAALEVLRQGVPRVRQWGDLDNPARAELAGALTGAIAQLLAAAENQRQLPGSTACVCPSCAVVRLPTSSDGSVFACECGRIWMVQGRAGHIPLADDFWDRAMPGDDFIGLVATAWATEAEDAA